MTIIDVSGAGRVGATTLLEGISSRTTLRDLVRTRELELTADTDIRFVRLVQLVGG